MNECVWSIWGMILTGENRNTWRNICPIVTWSTTNSTWNDLGIKPGLRGERPANRCLRHDTAFLVMTFIY